MSVVYREGRVSHVHMPYGHRPFGKSLERCMSTIRGISGVDGIVKLNILAKPNAKQSAITDAGDVIGVRLAAQPMGGQANAELVELLAKTFGIAKRDVSVERGGASRIKVVICRGINLSDADKALKEAVNQN